MEEYKKIGGWLLFFIISYCLGAFLIFKSAIEMQEIISMGSYLFSSLKMMGMIVWIAAIIYIIGLVAFILLLVKKDKRCINVFIISQVICLVLSIILYVMINNIAFINTSSMLVAVIRDAIVLGIWYQYFQKSERIKVYFS